MESETNNEKVKSPKSNITREKVWQSRPYIILPASKGNATVVMDKLEYTEKLAILVEDGSYSKVKRIRP